MGAKYVLYSEEGGYSLYYGIRECATDLGKDLTTFGIVLGFTFMAFGNVLGHKIARFGIIDLGQRHEKSGGYKASFS